MKFTIQQPPQILFGRGTSEKACDLTLGFGKRVLLVHGATMARAEALQTALANRGAQVLALGCATEPDFAMIQNALQDARLHRPEVVVAFGGGSVIDFGKALAALVPARTNLHDHLEVVGKGMPLVADPLPFVAVPTTAGTGAEVTRNAVIGLPEAGRKVSLRDNRMIARVAIVDPALTDHSPRSVTLAAGLDAVTQVVEPFISCKATPYTDALTRPAIGPGLAALMALMRSEDPAARDSLAYTSLCGGLALANAGLGAVHGLAGVIGGLTGAPHGAICGALLGPVLAVNHARSSAKTRKRIDSALGLLAKPLSCAPEVAPMALAQWAHGAGLPRLKAAGLVASEHAHVAKAAMEASSMKGNPVKLDLPDLLEILRRAS